MGSDANTYLHHWHLLKLRMIEARRLLFCGTSLFEFEYAAGQQRKIIEGIAQSWLVAYQIRDGDVFRELKKSHKPKAFYNKLKGKGIFPISARMMEETVGKSSGHWKIEQISTPEETAELVICDYENLHKWRHSLPPCDSYPLPKNFDLIIQDNFRKLAQQNQNIWNAHAQHIVPLNDGWFFLNLCPMDEASAPTIIQLDSHRVIGDDEQIFPRTELITGWISVPIEQNSKAIL